ncbi:MAG TPA: hypothetical protein GXX40_05845 [Firmicutes bacterium]|nr:hypothetical protein [Bacillota bacterium]
MRLHSIGSTIGQHREGLPVRNTHKLAIAVFTIVSCIVILAPKSPAPCAAPQFADVAGHWAADFLQFMAEKGFIDGYEDGSFRPDRTISREEFITVLVRAKGLSVSAGSANVPTFNDVDKSRWSYPYISTAVSVGMLRPVEYGYKLDPAKPIPRSEMASLLVRAAGLEAELSKTGRLITFSDLGDKNDMASAAVTLGHGLMDGYPDGTFRPKGSTTRAEACATIMRLLRPDLRPMVWSERHRYGSREGQSEATDLLIVRMNLNRPDTDLRVLPTAYCRTPGVTVSAITPGSAMAGTASGTSSAKAAPVLSSNPLLDKLKAATLDLSAYSIILSAGQIVTDVATPQLPRAAVGVTADGFVVFAYSHNVTRGALASMMRDAACTDALELWSPSISGTAYSPGLYIDGATLTGANDGAADKALAVIVKTPITGKPRATVEQAQKWAASHNATATFISLAPLYWEYCQKVGIRPEVAFCQAAKETNFGRFTGVVWESFHNPCGLKTSAGGSNEDPEAHQRFPDWATGVKAHVDHLALYAGAPGYPLAHTPDPRHFPKLYGTARYVEDLGGKWAPSPDYGLSIRLRGLKELLETE